MKPCIFYFLTVLHASFVGTIAAQNVVVGDGEVSGRLSSNQFKKLMQLRGGGGDHITKVTAVVAEEMEDDTSSTTNQNTIKKIQTFNLKEGITLTLSSDEVDKSFCDPSSPLSLAGYMNGEFSLDFLELSSCVCTSYFLFIHLYQRLAITLYCVWS